MPGFKRRGVASSLSTTKRKTNRYPNAPEAAGRGLLVLMAIEPDWANASPVSERGPQLANQRANPYAHVTRRSPF